jgi:hypothetical protein
VNDVSVAKGDYEITYDNVTEGSSSNVRKDMTMYVGTTLGGAEKGKIRVRSASGSVITTAENSHINWEDDDYLTIVNFYEINAIYPRILQDPADETNTLWYKDFDIVYTDQNSTLGSFICMGSHYAGFVDDDVYYTASGTFNLKGESEYYEWEFIGADVTGSLAHTPGYIGYSTPGHYTARLMVSGTASAYASYRHISIYERPEEGTNNPILGWELVSLGGTRDQGGYSGTIRIHDDIDEEILRDGSLIVIFADDKYGTTEKSIGGNALNRSTIVYVGYILNGTIRYNYRDSFVEFDVASPAELMKQADGFSVSVEDSADPAGQAASDDNYPSGWVLLLDMDVRRAIWHYLRWHSTVLKCVDFEFMGTDKKIQYFDADRGSLYAAINTLMSGTLMGRIVTDRQGKIWAETDIYIVTDRQGKIWAETDIYTEAGSYDDGVSIQKRDWMDDPFIEERNVSDVSFIEAGGIYYTGATGTYTPLLSVAPGEAPAYRGKVQRIQGLALTGQSQLNTLTGNIFAYRNAKYPNIEFRLAGNYRNYDIAPQEKVPLTIATIAPADTARGITFTNKDFFVNGLQYTYNSSQEVFLPVISLHELTSGVAGDTSVIPPVPPVEGDDGGFSIPPITIPPIEIPPYPDIEIPFIGVSFVDADVGWDGTDWINPRCGATGAFGIYLTENDNITGAGNFMTPTGWTGTLTIISLVHLSGSGNFQCRAATRATYPIDGSAFGSGGSGDDSGPTTLTLAGGINQVLPLTMTITKQSIIAIRFYRNGGNVLDTAPYHLDLYGWLISYS